MSAHIASSAEPHLQPLLRSITESHPEAPRSNTLLWVWEEIDELGRWKREKQKGNDPQTAIGERSKDGEQQ